MIASSATRSSSSPRSELLSDQRGTDAQGAMLDRLRIGQNFEPALAEATDVHQSTVSSRGRRPVPCAREQTYPVCDGSNEAVERGLDRAASPPVRAVAPRLLEDERCLIVGDVQRRSPGLRRYQRPALLRSLRGCEALGG